MSQNKESENTVDNGKLIIHHRRAGTCQPRDTIGFSCIMQDGNYKF